MTFSWISYQVRQPSYQGEEKEKEKDIISQTFSGHYDQPVYNPYYYYKKKKKAKTNTNKQTNEKNPHNKTKKKSDHTQPDVTSRELKI